jgi:pilus assembly protein CpaF
MNNPKVSGIRPAEITKLKEYLINTITRELEMRPPSLPERRKVVEQTLKQAYQSTQVNLAVTLRDQLFHEILDDILGYGPLQALIEDDDISEIMVNGPRNVFIERSGKIIKVNISFESDAQVLKLIDKIILPIGRRIDQDSPTVDARLPDGSRVNAVVPPVALDGPVITIRKFRKEKLTVQQLISLGSITQGMADFVRACVISKFNILVSGGTGSGKTTLLNVLSGFIPEEERIVTIEDAAELKLQQDHVVRMETKVANIEGKNAISIRDLVRNALRMRPDRIVVGEVRGGEALDMLQAMNTGHDGSLTTLHANSPRDALSRLETMCLMAGVDLPVKVIRQQIASAVDVIIQIARLKDGSRKVVAITEVAGMEGDTVVLTDIFKYEQTGITKEGQIIGSLKPTGIRPLFTPRLEASGFRLGPEIFGANLADMMSNRRR